MILSDRVKTSFVLVVSVFGLGYFHNLNDGFTAVLGEFAIWSYVFLCWARIIGYGIPLILLMHAEKKEEDDEILIGNLFKIFNVSKYEMLISGAILTQYDCRVAAIFVVVGSLVIVFFQMFFGNVASDDASPC